MPPMRDPKYTTSLHYHDGFAKALYPTLILTHVLLSPSNNKFNSESTWSNERVK